MARPVDFSDGTGRRRAYGGDPMSVPVIAVIDNGICNLRSVTKALEAVSAHPQVVRTPSELDAAEAAGLVLPGVGPCGAACASFARDGLGGAGARVVKRIALRW